MIDFSSFLFSSFISHCALFSINTSHVTKVLVNFFFFLQFIDFIYYMIVLYYEFHHNSFISLSLSFIIGVKSQGQVLVTIKVIKVK